MKKLLNMATILAIILLLAACADNVPTSNSSNDNSLLQSDSSEATETTAMQAINTSPDKYTWYIKNYVGKNCATLGYTSMSGDRFDRYGEGMLELIFVSPDGQYVDIHSEDILKEYCVIKQNLAPNTEMKYVFEKDSDGLEYDSLVESQSFEEIVLVVKKVGSDMTYTSELTAINAAPDKYTRYIVDYTGRNLATCGYTSMGGDLRHRYGEGNVELIIVADDGTYIDPTDDALLKNYVVIGQNIAPNTELTLVFDKDSNGVEYSNLVDTQNIEEVELYVSKLPSSDTTDSE